MNATVGRNRRHHQRLSPADRHRLLKVYKSNPDFGVSDAAHAIGVSVSWAYRVISDENGLLRRRTPSWPVKLARHARQLYSGGRTIAEITVILRLELGGVGPSREWVRVNVAAAVRRRPRRANLLREDAIAQFLRGELSLGALESMFRGAIVKKALRRAAQEGGACHPRS